MDLVKPYGEPVFPSMKGYEIAAQAGERDIGPTQMRMMVLKRNALQKAYVDRWNRSAVNGKARLDGIIQAVSPWCAPRLGGTQKGLYVGYTGVWNYLGKLRHPRPALVANETDFPSCTFPVTSADKTVDTPQDMKAFKQLSEMDGVIQSDYDADFYDGAPFSLQCIGRRLEEEKVLELVEVISGALDKARC